MKNIVFIPNIDLKNDRSNSYHYSIKSWKYWCNKNDCELLVWDELLFPIEHMKITWQRYYMFDILRSNDIEYNQVLMVDADTIVHPDCPNFFKETENKYCGVKVDGCYEWVVRSIKGFGDELFNGNRIKPWNYINGGFQIVNKSHRNFFESMKKYYSENSEKITITIDKLKCGTDQTIVNYMLHKEKIDIKLLPTCYNLQDMFKKSLLYLPGYSWWPDTLENLWDSGWVYHFNSIPQNQYNRDANYWMERIYRELYEK